MADRKSGPTSKIWCNGGLVNWWDATIHVMSHVVHYGSSVFEGIRCYETPNGPAIFRLPDHIRRLTDSCRIYRMEIPHSAETLLQACIDTVAANDVRHCYLRPVVARKIGRASCRESVRLLCGSNSREEYKATNDGR